MTKILDSIKKLLGIPTSVSDFDDALILNINSAFTSLLLLGAGPDVQFELETGDETWSDFMTDAPSAIKTYIYLSVRLTFDPPKTSFELNSIENQIQKLEFQINTITDEEVVYE